MANPFPNRGHTGAGHTYNSLMNTSRYLRLFLALTRFSLLGEMSFRANFLVKITVEVLWLFILLIFYRTIFLKTSTVATWTESQYLFFIGCYFAMEGLIETLFLENCTEFAELVRTGDLDFILLKPIDEQFLVSCRRVDWSTAANVLMGAGVMVMSLIQQEWTFNLPALLLFLALFVCGLAIAYSFLLLLMSTSVWLMRNQNLMEMWWLFTSLMRYPREIFQGSLGTPVGWFFTFVVPVLLVIYVPSKLMVGVFEPKFVGFMFVTALVLLFISRKVFRLALRKYRSASS
jgi:ABC-2 type transport system permease protein